MSKRDVLKSAVVAFNDGNLDGYMKIYDPSVTLHGYAQEPIDFAAAKGFYSMILSAVSGAELTIDDVIEQDDKLALRYTLTGTHGGDLMGVPASGRSIVLTGQTILRFNDADTVVERWQNADMLGLMVQIGAVPPPG